MSCDEVIARKKRWFVRRTCGGNLNLTMIVLNHTKKYHVLTQVLDSLDINSLIF